MSPNFSNHDGANVRGGNREFNRSLSLANAIAHHSLDGSYVGLGELSLFRKSLSARCSPARLTVRRIHGAITELVMIWIAAKAIVALMKNVAREWIGSVVKPEGHAMGSKGSMLVRQAKLPVAVYAWGSEPEPAFIIGADLNVRPKTVGLLARYLRKRFAARVSARNLARFFVPVLAVISLTLIFGIPTQGQVMRVAALSVIAGMQYVTRVRIAAPVQAEGHSRSAEIKSALGVKDSVSRDSVGMTTPLPALALHADADEPPEPIRVPSRNFRQWLRLYVGHSGLLSRLASLRAVCDASNIARPVSSIIQRFSRAVLEQQGGLLLLSLPVFFNQSL